MRDYVTDSKVKYGMGRVGQAEYAEKVRVKKLFKYTKTRPDMLCGNVSAYFTKKGECFLSSEFQLGQDAAVRSHKQISSALALYRTISLFECGLDSPKQQDFYKTNWSITLEHKESGRVVMLGEWKGGFQIFTDSHSHTELPECFLRDVALMLTLIANPKMPIGYDGTVAGSVA